jgi:RNA polymerase sigma-70 factor (ECF subfamily)
VIAARAGDPEAFAGLVRRYAPVAVAVALAHTGRAEVADEVAQEALIDAWRLLPTLREPDLAAVPQVVVELMRRPHLVEQRLGPPDDVADVLEDLPELGPVDDARDAAHEAGRPDLVDLHGLVEEAPLGLAEPDPALDLLVALHEPAVVELAARVRPLPAVDDDEEPVADDQLDLLEDAAVGRDLVDEVLRRVVVPARVVQVVLGVVDDDHVVDAPVDALPLGELGDRRSDAQRREQVLGLLAPPDEVRGPREVEAGARVALLAQRLAQVGEGGGAVGRPGEEEPGRFGVGALVVPGLDVLLADVPGHGGGRPVPGAVVVLLEHVAPVGLGHGGAARRRGVGRPRGEGVGSGWGLLFWMGHGGLLRSSRGSKRAMPCRKVRRTLPVLPFRCLATMHSAWPAARRRSSSGVLSSW